MRKIIILAGLLAGAALFSGTPAKAELGCTCVKLGSPTMCTAGIASCTFAGGGVCILPCDYTPAKMMMRHHRHHHHKKMAMKKKKM
jgi:hypothetical protein